MLPIQVYLGHLYFRSLVYLFVVTMFFISPALGNVSIYMTDLHG